MPPLDVIGWVQIAELLGMSVRQAQRICAEYEAPLHEQFGKTRANRGELESWAGKNVGPVRFPRSALRGLKPKLARSA